MRQMKELIRSASSSNYLSMRQKVFVSISSIERISCSPTEVGVVVDPGFFGVEDAESTSRHRIPERIEHQLNTYLIASGGVEPRVLRNYLNQGSVIILKKILTSRLVNQKAVESNSAVLLVNWVFNRSQNIIPGGVELESNWSPTPVNYRF